MTKTDLVKLWFLKAEEDRKNIDNNLQSEDIPFGTVCFHAQQMAEKYSKVIWFTMTSISRKHISSKTLSLYVRRLTKNLKIQNQLLVIYPIMLLLYVTRVTGMILPMKRPLQHMKRQRELENLYQKNCLPNFLLYKNADYLFYYNFRIFYLQSRIAG